MIDEVEEIRQILRDADSFAAIERIQKQGTPADITARYKSLIADLYWKARDLPAVVVIGRAGILYCLGQSLSAGISPEAADELRSAAKGLAYDIGSFTWPGWEEPGIHPTSEEISLGRECAALNLRLAIELKKPPARISMAHWLVGAHALSANDPEIAEREFQFAQKVLSATDADAKAMEPCNMGYLAIARLCNNPSDAAARASFDQIIAQLQARTDEDARFYLAQLLTARRRFAPPQSDPAISPAPHPA
jgi:hypothetical protein